MSPQLTPGIDVALLVFWAFVLFFVGLVFYLRREDRREGYPLEEEISGQIRNPGGVLSTASPKSFLLPFDQGVVTAPPGGGRDPFRIAARLTDRFAGAPYAPTGDPLADGIGPAAWADRAKRPDLDMEGHFRIVPLSTAAGYSTAAPDPGLIGWPLVGADGVVAGTIADLWIDKADRLIRYMQLDGVGAPALVPMMMAKVDRRRRRVVVDALNGAQFAGVPRLDAPDRITLYEEERVQAYFGGGYLYANLARQEPFL
ncbi:photosynthetic reaction center subunit H [Sphingomonas sp.]|jgi:photosynthetic reaction center H subunit|uniref:photosynthetic reaction center subunit H n=1 Tax=Sphingomonas sp. TaxID=28214 RepID=UPI002D810B77|nr:photosynthetic reaction center subunit H [Sphingomonas sp.]HEU0045649.1 photosynthetic reaction center subunit H [Sphingomonas sp.]